MDRVGRKGLFRHRALPGRYLRRKAEDLRRNVRGPERPCQRYLPYYERKGSALGEGRPFDRSGDLPGHAGGQREPRPRHDQGKVQLLQHDEDIAELHQGLSGTPRLFCGQEPPFQGVLPFEAGVRRGDADARLLYVHRV